MIVSLGNAFSVINMIIHLVIIVLQGLTLGNLKETGDNGGIIGKQIGKLSCN